MAFEKNKLPIWNLAGTLNELDPPSEVPLPDVISVNNWKPDRDGKSRIKRPGYDKLDAAYASFNEPIRGIFKYVDPDGTEVIVIVTRTGVVVRKDVYTWTRVLHDEDTFYDIRFNGFLYQGDMCHFHEASATTVGLMKTSDGVTWSTLATYTPTVPPNTTMNCPTPIVYADEIFTGLRATNIGDPLVTRYDGTFHEELVSPIAGGYCVAFHLWDGKLWILLYSTTTYRVYSYDGNAYSLIANYDGAGTIPTNSINVYASACRGRVAHFITKDNNLHLAVTLKDGGGKHTWEMYQFNPTLYDRFNKIYDSSGIDDYGICGIYNYNGKWWALTTKLTVAADYAPDGNDNELYSSTDLITWTLEKTGLAMGLTEGVNSYDGKLFVSSYFDYAAARTYKIWYWDSSLENFVNEINIATNIANPPSTHGNLLEFNGELYAFKYREIHVREITTNSYTTIYSTSEEILMSVAAGSVDDGRLTLALDEMVTLEGDTVYSLGLHAPVQAPDLAPYASIVIGATNNKIDFEETAGVQLTATLTNATYLPAAMAAEIKIQLDATGASVYTVTYEDDYTFKIVSDGLGGGGIFSLLCASGTTSSGAYAILGFSVNFDLTGSLTVISEPWGLIGLRKYVVTFQRSGNYPVESNPSPESIQVNPLGGIIDISNIPVSPDPKVNARRIYATTAGGERFYWMADIADNATTTYRDEIDDNTLLGGTEVSYDRGVPPIGPYMEVWDNRMWIAGVEGFENYLYRTNLGTSEEMADANFIPVKARESDKIKQIKAFGDKLYVWKANSLFGLSKVGGSLYELEQIPQNIGTDSPWSVQVCDKFLIWKSAFGVEVFNGNSCFRPIVSDLVQVTLATINPEALNKIVGGHNFDDGEYWMAIPTGSNTEPDTVVVYNYMKRWFTIYTFPEDLTFLMSTKTKVEGLMFLTGTAEGNVYIQGSGFDDDGAAISSHFQMGWFNMISQKELANVIRRMFIKYQLPTGMTLTCDIFADMAKTAIATCTFTGMTPTTIPTLRNDIVARQNLRIPGTYASFKFTNNEITGGEVKVVGFDLYFNRDLKWNYGVKAD